MVPEGSRTQSVMVKLGSKEDIWGLKKKKRYMGLEEKDRVWLCHGALTRKVPNDFLWEDSASWIRKPSHSLRACLLIHTATHSHPCSLIHLINIC